MRHDYVLKDTTQISDTTQKVTQIYQLMREQYLNVILFVADKFTYFIQVLLEVVPPEKNMEKVPRCP